MRLLISVLATLIAGLALALAPTAAQAHTYYQYHGNDMGYVGSGHSWGGIADRECDGNRAFLLLGLRNGNVVEREDGNGCNNGIREWTVGSDVVWSRMCEGRDASYDCNAPVNHY